MATETTRGWGRVIPFFLVLIIAFFIGFFVSKHTNKESPMEIYKTKIDSLQNKLDSLYNIEKEVDLQIDTVTIILKETQIEYEKKRDTILNNTPDENYKFFTDYLNSNRERLYNNSNN